MGKFFDEYLTEKKLKINGNFFQKNKNYFKKFLFFRLSKPATKVFGPFYKQNHDVVQMDITYDCSLKCFNCARQCSQAQSKEYITIEQIKKFIEESISQDRRWKILRIMGGEPTLHPDLFEILDLLIVYKLKFSPKTVLLLETNNFGEKVKSILTKIPKEIEIYSTDKKSRLHDDFIKINIAPVDLLEMKNFDYSNACQNKQNCGMGFTPYGFYNCGTAGGIDRVFGLDVAKKSLPSRNDMMSDQSDVLCRYCGFFWAHNGKIGQKKLNKMEISESWKKALNDYKEKKPNLAKY